MCRDGWSTASSAYQLLISELVIDECSDGDPTAVAERLQVVEGIALLRGSDQVELLAESLMENHAVPRPEPRDSFHIAIAAVHGVQYLATWNFKHILNPTLQNRIAAVCRENGFEPPVICTPEQLLEAQHDS